jgi:hypothetical protein
MSSQSYIFNPTERTLAAAGDGFSCPRLTTAGRTALALTAGDKGMMVYDTTLTDLCIWNGTAWEFVNDNSNGILSVKDFGAKGDGVTDDTAAIQAGVNAAMAGAGILYFPANDPSQFYKITAPINIPTPITIVGAGPRYTAIIGIGMALGQYIFNISNAVSTNYFFSIRDIQIRSDNGQPSGVLLKDSSYCLFKNVLLYTVYNGIDITNTALQGCFSNFFEQVNGYNNTAYTVRFLSYSGGGHFKFDSCTFSANIGFFVDSNSALNNLELISCNFEQCGANSMYINGGVEGFSINGCRTEGNNGGQDFFIDPVAGKSVVGMSITGTFFTTDVGASNPIRIGGSGGIVRGFNICGNHVSYAADGTAFVFLNGEGESGLIAGNYFTRPTATPTNTTRPGVVVFGNESSAGKSNESWGLASWAVVQSTFIPVDASGAGLVLTAKEGFYQQIGNMVFYQAAVQYPVTADASVAQIGGLPKNIYAGSFPAGRSGSGVSKSTGGVVVGVSNVTGSNAVNFVKAAGVNATNADLSGGEVYFFGQYRIA